MLIRPNPPLGPSWQLLASGLEIFVIEIRAGRATLVSQQSYGVTVLRHVGKRIGFVSGGYRARQMKGNALRSIHHA